MAKKTHILKMTNGSLVILNGYLSSDKWAGNAKDLYRAGELMTKFEETVDAMPDPNSDLENHKEWVRTPFEMEVSEKQRETCKKATEEAIKRKEKVHASGIMLNPLLLTLGLAGSDDDEDEEDKKLDDGAPE